MCTERILRNRRQCGVTLIELIIFIVIISVGLFGILSVMNITTRHSADPMRRKQATAMAEAVLEEVLAKNYCDPDLVPPACGESREASRGLYDDIADYNGQTINGDVTLGAGPVAALAGFVATVTVAAQAPVSGVAMRQVTVTVAGGIEPITISGYRAAGF